ncbi:metal-binding protein [Desulfurococcus mucosus]|uniref:SWIM-type domain-containing protein n=1 Tax=Desulfurococcus mucosus (strain ATCC 35584 / DSM 2162 / JCM 9187 / O7/1) TaxID=765177 RepID=E8RAQ8_DESM0|nr:metal-binding protein [Desulfurococcus mucosus]ADV65494.1 hypothetical protein Desmu_1197 [Desulfurococcus mucosus DSM 2162]
MDLRETRSRLSTDSSALTLEGRNAREVLSLVYSYRFVRLVVNGGEIWVYTGPERDYVAIPGTYCSCMDFAIRVVSRGETPYCKHLLGLEVARRLGKYREVRLGSEEAVAVVREALFKGFSKTLHRMLYKY